MRVVMYQEFFIESSYTLEASLSGYKGFHFSLSDLQMMGRDFCLSLLQMHRNQTMQFHCNTDMQIINPKHLHSYNEICSKQFDSTKSFPKSNLSSEEDSAGSESNPSEDNISESEALELLSHAHPLAKKKKKKKKSGSMKKKRGKQLIKRDTRHCQIGVTPHSIETKNTYNAPPHEARKQVSEEKRSLQSLTFPLYNLKIKTKT